jgi:DNA-binding winged helix-turn-helix (wHTH) protein
VRALEDSVYRIGDAQISLSARSVCRNGESLRLRPKNFDLLRFLIRRRGSIATKDEILSEVWPGVAVTENSLVKCVSELRRALGDDLRNPRFLKSVPKVGYELVGAIEEVPDSGRLGETALEVQQTTTVQVEYREELSSDARSWRKPLVWGLAAAGVLLLAGAFRGLPGSWGTPAPAPVHWREVAWWKLDEGKGSVVRDASGNSLDGDLTKGATWAAGGLRFNGFDAAVIGRTRGVLPVGDSPRTMSAWIRTAVPLVDNTAIFNYGRGFRGPDATSFSFGLLNDGRISFGSHILHGYGTGTRRLDDDAWHMVTTTYDGGASSMGSIFIDGKLDRAERLERPPSTSDGPFWQIGRFLAAGTDFRGNIKDVRVFKRALTESQIAALYSCTAAAKDLGDYYYLPVSYPGFVREARATDSPSTPLRSAGTDFVGMQLAKSDGQCAITSVEGADAGQNLRISMDVLTPSDAKGSITQAGPYFRSRIAGPGDGLMGGSSAGYWVQLHSTGMVKVRRLNPLSVVAFSSPISGFDTEIFHSLTVEARGTTLQVWLDGKPLWFEQAGRPADRVEIPAAWESPERIGQNQGAAGVAFGAENNRGQIGGQRVKNLTLVRLD